MLIKTWIKYEEGYLPPRCRKLRYRECEDYINADLQETHLTDMKLAFEDNSYSGKGKIYLYGDKLWSKAKKGCFVSHPEEYGLNTPLEELKHSNEFCSWFFPRDWRDGEHPNKDRMELAVKNYMVEYLLVDGELYQETAEPRYVINTFGLGHNHGGTGMFVDYHYNPNIRNDNYFSALDGKKAVEYANKIAAGRGDTNDVGKFTELIIVHMPELVTVNPKQQHGEGNEFINTMEKMIDGSGTTAEAGLLCMMFAAASGAKSEK